MTSFPTRSIQENLSKHLLCQWTIYQQKPTNSSNPYNIISVTYFLPKGKSNNGSKKYFQGLQKLFFDMRKILPKDHLRIYHDISVKQKLYDFLASLPKKDQSYLELFQYDIPYLYDGNANHHKGTTGTLWRFLPLMNYTLHHCDRKIVLDIDSVTNHELLKLSKICDEKNDVYFMYRSHPYYYTFQRITCFDPQKSFFYYVVAHFIYQTNELAKEILENFLDQYIYQIQPQNLDFLLHECYPKNGKNTKNRNIHDSYQYGIDEIFMNGFYVKKQFEINPRESKELVVLYILSSFQYKKIIYSMAENISQYNLQNTKFNQFWFQLFSLLHWIQPLTQEKIYDPKKNIFYFNKLQSYILENDSFYHHLDKFMKNKKHQQDIQQLFQTYATFPIPDPNLKKFLDILNTHQYHSFMLYPFSHNSFQTPRFISYQNTIL